MPKRTNLFQEVVTIIYGHLAGEAVMEESAMLRNRLTHLDREVDVVLRITAAGHETVLAIEAAARSRPASVDWVEQMVGKHRNLPTDKVILVAEAGFSAQALALARAEKMVPLTPQSLSAGVDRAEGVINALPTLWPKTVSLSPEHAKVWVTRPDGSEVWFRAPADLDLVFEDGASAFTLVDFFRFSMQANFRRAMEQIKLADIEEDLESKFTIQIGPPVTVGIDGEVRQLYARWTEANQLELHRIERVALTGNAVIHLSEIALERKRLGEINVNYAFGEGSIAGRPALLVVSGNPDGEKLTIRIRDEDDRVNGSPSA